MSKPSSTKYSHLYFAPTLNYTKPVLDQTINLCTSARLSRPETLNHFFIIVLIPGNSGLTLSLYWYILSNQRVHMSLENIHGIITKQCLFLIIYRRLYFRNSSYCSSCVLDLLQVDLTSLASGASFFMRFFIFFIYRFHIFTFINLKIVCGTAEEIKLFRKLSASRKIFFSQM